MLTGSDALVLMAVVAGSAAAAAIDIRTRRVPNVLTLGIASAGVIFAMTGAGRVTLGAAVGGSLVGALLMLPGHLFGGTGAGDVKLMSAFGTVLGPAGILDAFLAMAIAGGLIAAAIGAYRRLAGRSDNRFAYAPAIAIGVCAAAVGW